MENASKALLIAAGVLFAIIILSVLLIGYNQISEYYRNQSNLTEEEQRLQFNKKFENYDGNEVRGNELLSIMNMIDDYNELETEKGNKKMKIEIDLIDSQNYKQFHYDEGNFGYLLSGTNSKITENKISEFSKMTNECITDLKGIGSSVTPTETLLQQLSSNIANIIVNESDTGTSSSEARRKRADLLKNIFKIEICEDAAPYITTDTNLVNAVNTIKSVTRRYYEFTQFKRAHFKCEGLEYDNANGRVTKMTFKVLIDNNGNVKFN